MCGTMLSAVMIKKTRKSHRCFGCARTIPKGTMAEKFTSVDGRDLLSSYTCLDCLEFMKTDSGRAAQDDDGCIWPDVYSDEPYARFPILIPVQP